MSDEKKKEDELLNSDYDGIKEYDNDLPRWWLWLFYLTIVFTPVYVFWAHVYPGHSQEEWLAMGLAEIEAKKSAAAEKLATTKVSDGDENEAILALAKDGGALTRGQAVYGARCAACHGGLGEGLIGPNLTDEYWIHGGTPVDMKRVIVEGVLAKGMVSWKGILSDTEMNEVVAFMVSLKGTNPANAKPPQGEKVG